MPPFRSTKNIVRASLFSHFLIIVLLFSSLSSYSQYFTRFASVQYDSFTKFKNYYLTDGICSYQITDMVQDKYGFMWFATREGLMRFDGYTFETYKMGDFPNTLPHSDVRKIVEDGSGRLWVGTMGGLCYYNPKTNDFTRVTHLFGKQLQGGKGVFALFVDSKGRLWADMQEGILHCIDFYNETLETFQHLSRENDNYYFQSISEINGGIFLGGANSHLTLLSFNTKRWFNFKDTTVNNNNLRISAVAQFFHKDENELWVANFSHWSYSLNKKTLKRDYLPFVSAYTFEKHTDGRVWVGGYSGGAKLYNPLENTITIFKNNENNPYSLSGEQIYKIYADKQGNIWFATNGGLSVLSPHRNRYKHIRKIPESGGLPTNKITSILPEGPNTLWLGTDNSGLIKFDLKAGAAKTFKFFNNPDSIGSNTVTHVTRYNDETLLLTLWNGNGGALNSFNIPKQKFTRYHTPDKYYWYRSVQKHSNGQVFVGSWGGSVMPFDIIKRGYYGRYYSSLSNSFYSTQIAKTHTIHASKNGWVVAYTDKLIAINEQKGDSVIIVHNYNNLNNQAHNGVNVEHLIIFNFNEVIIDKVALLNQKVIGILSDKSSSLVEVDLAKKTLKRFDFNLGKGFASVWADTCIYLGTSGRVYRWDSVLKKPIKIIDSEHIGEPTSTVGLSAGLMALGANNGLFVVVYKGVNNWQVDSKLLSSNVNQALSIDGLKFFATSEGLIQLNKEGKIEKRLLDGINVVAITDDSTGHLWISTDRSLFRMNLQLGSVEEVLPNTKSPNGLLSNIVYSLTTDARGNVWMVTKRCVSMCNPQTMKFTNYVEPNEIGIFSNLVSEMFEDSRANLWVGFSSKGGVSSIDPISQKVRSYVHMEWDSLSFPNASTWSISESSNGQMLFGTSEGLAIMEGDKNRFRLIDDRHGLPSKEVTAVLQDRNGLVWVGTSSGIAKFNLNSGLIEPVLITEGGLPGTITDMQYLGTDQIVVAGEWGLNIFNPNQVSRDTTTAPIYIISIYVNGTISNYFPENGEKIILEASHKTLEISFVALNYSASENIKYSYQLEGFEDSLTYLKSNILTVKYSNLPWGKYTFKVFCTNADGVWGNTPAHLFIKVKLPIYLRWWFIIICISTLGVLFYFIVKTREAYLKAENARLDSIVQERTEEVLAQNEELRVQQEIISAQSDEIKQVNLHLTDSIEYALTLQNALMPTKLEVETVLGASMLIFKPKDIVSGDFYWLKGTYEKFTLVVGDCTGHGVHGGFMSMMGLTFISESYTAIPNANPLEILFSIHQHFSDTLKLGTNNPTLTSGMDIAICNVDRQLGLMSYCGTRLPLYLLRRNDNNYYLDKFKSGKKPVGSPWFSTDAPLIEIPIKTGDTIVIASDGAFDQLSLLERKRFNRAQFEDLLLKNQPQPIENLSVTIERALANWQGKGVQTDDITVVGFVI